MYLTDMHVHTDDSPDAEISAEELVVSGLEQGLVGIGFVAHVDLNPEDHCYDSFNPVSYDASLALARNRAGGEIEVYKGIEVGEPHIYQDEVQRALDYSSYDFITGALHTVEGVGMVLGKSPFENTDPLEVVEKYYLETLRMVEEADIDILAHMGLFRRGLAQAGIRCDFNELDLWPDIMESILRVLIERDIAMELNTSGLRRRERTTYPTPDILIRYHDLGGTMITIGSDTHRKQHLFYGLKAGIEILRQAGFDSILTFRDRERRQLFVNGSVPSAAAQK